MECVIERLMNLESDCIKQNGMDLQTVPIYYMGWGTEKRDQPSFTMQKLSKMF